MYTEMEFKQVDERNHNLSVTVSLRGEMAEFVRREIREGLYAEPEELVYEALRARFRKQMRLPFEIS